MARYLVVGAWLLLATLGVACTDDSASKGGGSTSVSNRPAEEVVPFKVVAVQSPPDLPADSPWRKASIKIESAPSSVKEGSAVKFVVAVTNESNSEIDPGETCPSYFMSFGDSGLGAEPVTSLLNCDEAQPIPSGGVERFAMEIELPSDLQGLDFGTIYWRLESVGDATTSQIPVRD